MVELLIAQCGNVRRDLHGLTKHMLLISHIRLWNVRMQAYAIAQQAFVHVIQGSQAMPVSEVRQQSSLSLFVSHPCIPNYSSLLTLLLCTITPITTIPASQVSFSSHISMALFIFLRLYRSLSERLFVARYMHDYSRRVCL